MKKAIAVFAATGLLLAACGSGPVPDEDMPEFDSEHRVACYSLDGKFKQYDDDCHDEIPRQYTKRELEQLRAASQKASPVKTSGGMKTSGPIKPGTTYKNPPARKR